MAIQKTKTLPSGAVGNYWRIKDIHIDRQNLKLRGHLGLFKDQATSNSGAPDLGFVKSFAFPLNMVEFLAAPNVIALMYSKIMAHSEELIYFDITGAPLNPPIQRDPDLANGALV